jgi:hypothetical protein
MISLSWAHWPLSLKFSNSHKSHDQISLTPLLYLTRQKTGIQHIDFPQSLFQKSLQKTTLIPCVIDLVDLMDYCSLLEFPKSGYLFLKSKIIKLRYEQNTNTNIWKELLVVLKTFRTFHHSPCPTIKSSSKIDTLLFWIHCVADCFVFSFETKI